jgi:phenylalanyl-tRNA synthetase beta chain
VYLPQGKELPEEKRVLGLSSGRGFLHLKGVIEAIVQTLMPGTRVEVDRAEFGLLAPGHAATLRLNDRVLGVMGDVAQVGLDQFDLRSPATVAEIDLAPLIEGARLIPRARPLVNYQSVTQDLNVVFGEQVAWAEVERIVVDTLGDLLERLEFQEVYRDEKRLGPGKKSLLWSMTLRPKSGTLAGGQVDALRDKLIADLAQQLGGELRT